MTHRWYDAAGGLGLLVADSPDRAEEDWQFAGLIRHERKFQYIIERHNGATDVRLTMPAAQARLLAMVGATRG